MAKYKKNRGSNTSSEKTIQDAESIAKGIQKPGQTKEQTKLVAQGIQKGIEQYKKQQKSKARDLDKQLKKAKQGPAQAGDAITAEVTEQARSNSSLPWTLLVLSWGAFIAYIYLAGMTKV